MRRTRQSTKISTQPEYREEDSSENDQEKNIPRPKTDKGRPRPRPEHEKSTSSRPPRKSKRKNESSGEEFIGVGESSTESSSDDFCGFESESKQGRPNNNGRATKPRPRSESDDDPVLSSDDSESSSFEPARRKIKLSKPKRKVNLDNSSKLQTGGIFPSGKLKVRPSGSVKLMAVACGQVSNNRSVENSRKRVSKKNASDSSSDSSSDEFQRIKPSEAVDFTSEYFNVDKESKPTPTMDFSEIENNILSGITSTLSDSESEAEYTQVNWPCLPGMSTDSAIVDQVSNPSVNKPSSRSRKRGKQNKIKVESKDTSNLDVLELLKLGEGASTETVKNVAKFRPSDEDLTDLEEVILGDEDGPEVNEVKKHVIPKEGVQITLAMPELHQKRKKKDFDMEAYLLRKLNNRKRSIQVLIHKVHILGWLAHGRYVNSTLCSEELLAICLSLIPSKHCYPPKRADLAYLENILKWFHKTVSLKENVVAKYPTNLLESLISQVTFKVANSKRELALIFICLLRSLGIKVRLVLSLQPAPLKLASHEFISVLPRIQLRVAKEKIKDEVEDAVKEEKSGDIVIKSEDTSVTKKSIKSKSNNKANEKTQTKKSDESKNDKVQTSEYFDKKTNYGKGKNKAEKTVHKVELEKCTTEENDALVKMNKSRRSTSMPTGSKSKYFKTSENTRKEIKSEKIDALPSTSKKHNENELGSTKEITAKSEIRAKSQNKKDAKVMPKRLAKVKVEPLIKTADSECDSNSDFEPESKRPRRKDSPPKKKNSRKLTVKSEISKKKIRSKASLQSNSKRAKLLSMDDTDDDSDFEPHKNLSEQSQDSTSDSHSEIEEEDEVDAPVVKKPPKVWSGIVDRRVLSSNSSDDDASGEVKRKDKRKKVQRKKHETKKPEKKIGIDVWVEVFLEAEEKWFCVDVPLKKVHCFKELHAKATQPVLYVVGFGSDLSIKDVTRRYVVNWTTIKQRVDESWWEKALKPFLGKKTPQDREEDEQLSDQMLNHPLPTVIGEYKDHPLYALKRHLLKFEALYPSDTPTLGFVRGEGVYARDCVYSLHSREIWNKEAKVVKEGEQPYKIVKARPKYDRMSGCSIPGIPLELFGVWQVGDYIPPVAKDGKVPRNEYGNVELFKACMLPKGTVHLPIPGLSRVARKLAIDCAPAMIGFDYHCGGSHPTYDGYVVCEEFKDILLDAWNQEVVESAKRAAEKREKRVYDNWKRLIRGLLIRRRLKERYSFGESQPSSSKTNSSKTAPTETVPSKTASSKTASSKTAPTETVPSKTAPSKTAPSKTASSKTASSKTAPTETVPSKTAPSKTASSKAAPSETVPSKTAPSKTAKTAPSETAQSKTASSKTALSKTAPSKTASSKAAPSKTAQSKTAQSKTAQSRTARSETAPSKPASNEPASGRSTRSKRNT